MRVTCIFERALCLCLLISSPFLSYAQATMDNADVIRQKQLGDTDAQIIATIKRHHTAFVFDDVSRQALVSAGISMAVQLSMYGSSNNPPKSTTTTLQNRNLISPPLLSPNSNKTTSIQAGDSPASNAVAGAANSHGSGPTPSDLQVLSTIIQPLGCGAVPSPSNNFITTNPVTPAPTIMGPEAPKGTWVMLNANSSGAEIYTKSTVYVGYINRLRYGASLGGVVTMLAVPPLPSQLFPSSPVATQNSPNTNQKAPKPAPATAATAGQLIQSHFNDFNNCLFNKIQPEVSAFEGKLASEEIMLNGATTRIKSTLDSLQPIANSANEARAAADLSIFPRQDIPQFPIAEVTQLRGLLQQFASLYTQFSPWASSDSTDTTNSAVFQAANSLAGTLTATLDKYLDQGTIGATEAAKGNGTTTGIPNPMIGAETKVGGVPSKTALGTGTNAGTVSDPAKSADAATVANKGANSSLGGGTLNPPIIPVGSKEVTNYEANRTFVQEWQIQFEKVAGANDSYFITYYAPPCGGYFGQGTSTQMQLTVIDNWDLTQKLTPITLDKIICEPAITITNGLGLSFISDRTPAFVPGVEKNSQGIPILDSTGNPVIVQTLGYSTNALVRPGYALQVDASLWSPKQMTFEMHWSVGAMLTAATGGATTDIITGPAFSFKRRAFFVSPVYDLGLRTEYQKGFVIGMPQGNLTSPPTQQVWKSGFGFTITFPFNQSTNTTTSTTNSGNASQTPTGTQQPKGSDKAKTK
ncbi:hypothetical protein [Tunturibacter empetritectus]|uniref:Uncharacterized protein n=1 Tax=Tunturiibacter lichenicola TaxID=2051959 RepID=A0A7W8N3R5_9BACT|nr:hypothetical protein [Edaphobacter lichenicola]MBB5344464.1 hypothetical protein [Edaphobacter lichenicola]